MSKAPNIFYDADLVRQKMNCCGKEEKPFFFMLNFELTEGCFIENPLEQSEVFFQMNGRGNKLDTFCRIENGQNTMTILPLSKESYKSRFDIIREGLYNGNSFLTNLTVKTEIETSLSLDTIFGISDSLYQLYIPNRFVCFSPERFVKIENGKISTNPMKGTIDASLPNADKIILNDFKETAEHNTIVDLLRNDLSMSATDVHIERFRYIDRIKTQEKEILQISSEIVGDLLSDYKTCLGNIIFKMLPAGSVSGAPKESTVRLIQEAEKELRGYYTGIAGYFDGEILDSAVLIRFIEIENEKMFFRSGGGITAYSRWEDEYQEVLDKIYLPFKV